MQMLAFTKHAACRYADAHTPMLQILLARADKDYPGPNKAPLRFIRSCSSALAAATLHKLEHTFHAPVLEVTAECSAAAACAKAWISRDCQVKRVFARGCLACTKRPEASGPLVAGIGPAKRLRGGCGMCLPRAACHILV